MARKKWTAKEEVTEALLKFRDKRKWQQALRRYVLEKQICENYAPYFGLDIQSFREWIEIQFTDDLHWDNFASKWQFGHIIPVAYFDFNSDEDLKLCWNFINIRVEKIDENVQSVNGIHVIAIKPYFEALYSKTNYFICNKMLAKINQIINSSIISQPTIETFINTHKSNFEIMYHLSPADFVQINRGASLQDVLLEKEILKKFG